MAKTFILNLFTHFISKYEIILESENSARKISVSIGSELIIVLQNVLVPIFRWKDFFPPAPKKFPHFPRQVHPEDEG